MEQQTSINNAPVLHPVLEQILNKREIYPEQYPDFFSWDLRKLPDLMSLIDIEKTAKRIVQAMELNEKIGIYGDYDVDGTTSCALFYQYFKIFL